MRVPASLLVSCVLATTTSAADLATLRRDAKQAARQLKTIEASLKAARQRSWSLDRQWTLAGKDADARETIAARLTTARLREAAWHVRWENARRRRRQALGQAQVVARRAGQFVSFANEVAPIFVRHCLACHGARVARGRLDMESYAALLRGGENGAILTPGDPDLSTLCELIDDGLMPASAPPLPAPEQQLIRRWVHLGAELDAHVEPEASLAAIVPRRVLPRPPTLYRRPFPVTAVCYSPDGRQLVTSGYRELLVWEAATGTLLKRIPGVAERVYAVSFHPNGSQLAVASGTPGEFGEADIVELGSGRLRHLVSTVGSLFGIRYSPDGKFVATAGADRAIRVYEATSGRLVLRMADHAKPVMDVAFSPDGSRLASASRDKNAKVFSLQTGQQLSTYQKSSEGQRAGMIFSVAFSHDGRHVVSGGNDNLVRIWKADDARLVRTLSGFEGSILRLVVTADGHVITACADGRVRVHALADGTLKASLLGHKEWVYSVDIDPRGLYIASGAWDGRVLIHRRQGGKPVRALVAVPGLAR